MTGADFLPRRTDFHLSYDRATETWTGVDYTCQPPVIRSSDTSEGAIRALKAARGELFAPEPLTAEEIAYLTWFYRGREWGP